MIMTILHSGVHGQTILQMNHTRSDLLAVFGATSFIRAHEGQVSCGDVVMPTEYTTFGLPAMPETPWQNPVATQG